MGKNQFSLKNDFLFLRLASAETNDGLILDGNQTIAEYQKEISSHGTVWYGTDSLYYGIAKSKLEAINNCLSTDGRIKVVFVISNRGNGDNTISFVGEVVEVISSREKTQRFQDVPRCFSGNTHKIWLKLSSIEPVNELKTTDLKVKSTNNILSKAIQGSRFQMGYLCKI